MDFSDFSKLKSEKLTPLDLIFSIFLEKGIGPGKRMRSEKSLVSGKWTGVWRSDDMMSRLVDERRF